MNQNPGDEKPVPPNPSTPPTTDLARQLAGHHALWQMELAPGARITCAVDLGEWRKAYNEAAAVTGPAMPPDIAMRLSDGIRYSFSRLLESHEKVASFENYKKFKRIVMADLCNRCDAVFIDLLIRPVNPPTILVTGFCAGKEPVEYGEEIPLTEITKFMDHVSIKNWTKQVFGRDS